MAKRTINSGMTKPDQLIYQALQQFTASVTANFKALAAGEPEAQLTNPIEAFFSTTGKALGYKHFVAKRESQLQGRLGRPDYAVLANKLLIGYIELKEPGKGANPNSFKGHDRQQANRFKVLPNLIYTDGNQWALYRDGQRVGQIIYLSGDVTTDGKSAVKPADLDALKPLLTDFFAWQPIIPTNKKGQIDLNRHFPYDLPGYAAGRMNSIYTTLYRSFPSISSSRKPKSTHRI